MLKLAYKNFTENKIRTLAVIITVTLATVILFLCFIYQHTVEAEFFKGKLVEAENVEIRIEYSPESSSRIISTTSLTPLSDKIDFAVGVLDLYGTVEVTNTTEYINLRGIEEEGLDKINNLTIVESLDRTLRSDEIIIDESTATALNLAIDSSIKIKVGSKTKTFYVAKIVKDHLSFKTNGAYVIYCMENAASEYIGGHFGKLYNKIYIKILQGTDIDALIAELQAIEEYSNYRVIKEVDSDTFINNAKAVAMPMIMALSACVGLAIFLVFIIINASLKRRTLFISRLKAIGATDIYIAGVFILESTLYVIFGVIVGVITNFFIMKSGIPNLITINSLDTFYMERLLFSALIISVLVFLCISIPIIKVRRASARNVYVTSKVSSWKGSIYTPIVAAIMLISAIILILPQYLNSDRGIAAFALGFIGILLILPYLARFISNLLKNHINNGVGFIAVNNFGRERMSANNLRIIFSGIVICSIIASAAIVTENISDSVFNDLDCDIIIRNVQDNSDIQLNNIARTEGIYDVYGVNIKSASMELLNKPCALTILGAKPEELDNIGTIEYITPKSELIAAMDDGIVLTYMYHKIYKVNIGDEIAVTLKGVTKNIKVTAFFNSYQYGGSFAIMSNKFLSETFDIPLYDTIVCKTFLDINTAVSILRAENGASNLIIVNKTSVYLVYANVLKNTVTFAYWFALIIIAVCFISVFANIINLREEMKTVKYQMFSLGFNKIRLMLIELIEYAFIGILALSTSLIFIPFFNGALTNILSISDFYIVTPLSIITFAIIGGSYILFTLILAFTSYFTVNKKKVLKILRYE